MPKPLWVDGWLTQLLLLIAGGVALWNGLGQQATTYIIGACIVGVIRQIERTRRKGEDGR